MLEWPIKVQTSTWLKNCGGSLIELRINECLQIPTFQAERVKIPLWCERLNNSENNYFKL